MEIIETKLIPPSEFAFPFTPYSVQKDLMHNLYEALEGKKLAIFESPTGTGKSMSLICGSLKWLFDAQKRLKEDIILNIKNLDEELKKTSLGSNWLDGHALQVRSKQKKDCLQDFLIKITSMEKRIDNIKENVKKINGKIKLFNKLGPLKLEQNNGNNNIKNNNDDIKNNIQSEEDDCDILLDDCASDDNFFDNEYFSESEVEAEEKENYNGIKVFLCSRTHSQLSQLVREVQKSPYKDLNVRVISLASRQNYCINESVLNLKYLPLINDKCQELHNKNKGKTTKSSSDGESLKKQKTTSGCQFYKQTNIENIKLKILTEIKDIEQLVTLGKELNGCPYYASRQAVDEAQLILVPYNTILHKNTRLAYGIDLKNSVVIIDEAHNLLDAIGNMYSCTVTGLHLAQSFSQLVQYRDKYNDRFSAINLLHLNQRESKVTVETIAEFVLSCEIDTINFYKLLEFVTKSKIVYKLQGFVSKYRPSVVIHRKSEEKGVSAFLKMLSMKKEEAKQEDEEAAESEYSSGNPLMTVVNFVQTLTNHCLDGRIIATQNKTVGTSSLKYLLLNPASQFKDIVREARSVILAGGTMQPISEFTDQLFYLAGGTPDRISVFTCGHIISENNILPIIVSNGPSGKTFDFSYQKRNSTDVQDELGRLLINVCNVVPGGVVCFFPSYDFENLIYQRFERTKVIEKLQNKKKIVREPKKSNKVDTVLKVYAAAVKSQGALLFSVVGGKLSEGLNFSDDLGRCIIVVGLPYPNLMNPELKEKMTYLDTEVGPSAGKTYYENLCMKAVNQSIGRSIRHKDDYASVLLIDQRYFRSRCVNALPEWIRKSLRKEENFGPVVGVLARFFAAKKKKASMKNL